jgi:hypothetical protein
MNGFLQLFAHMALSISRQLFTQGPPQETWRGKSISSRFRTSAAKKGSSRFQKRPTFLPPSSRNPPPPSYPRPHFFSAPQQSTEHHHGQRTHTSHSILTAADKTQGAKAQQKRERAAKDKTVAKSQLKVVRAPHSFLASPLSSADACLTRTAKPATSSASFAGRPF